MDDPNLVEQLIAAVRNGQQQAATTREAALQLEERKKEAQARVTANVAKTMEGLELVNKTLDEDHQFQAKLFRNPSKLDDIIYFVQHLNVKPAVIYTNVLYYPYQKNYPDSKTAVELAFLVLDKGILVTKLDGYRLENLNGQPWINEHMGFNDKYMRLNFNEQLMKFTEIAAATKGRSRIFDDRSNFIRRSDFTSLTDADRLDDIKYAIDGGDKKSELIGAKPPVLPAARVQLG